MLAKVTSCFMFLQEAGIEVVSWWKQNWKPPISQITMNKKKAQICLISICSFMADCCFHGVQKRRN